MDPIITCDWGVNLTQPTWTRHYGGLRDVLYYLLPYYNPHHRRSDISAGAAHITGRNTSGAGEENNSSGNSFIIAHLGDQLLLQIYYLGEQVINVRLQPIQMIPLYLTANKRIVRLDTEPGKASKSHIGILKVYFSIHNT